MIDKPEWLVWAEAEIGEEEIPGPGSNQRILEYRKIGNTPLGGEDGEVPWCAIFVNAALEASDYVGTQSAMARSYANDEDFVKLDGPALGAIAVLWRKSRGSGLGHVGFYAGETATHVYLVGGNQGDSVSLAPFPKNGRSMGLLGYYWPESAELPEIEAIPYRGRRLNDVSAT